MPRPPAATLLNNDPLGDLFLQYPKLKKLGIQFKDSTEGGKDWRGQPYGSRKMEFYPADESYNPNPGKPTIEKFSKDVGTSDYFGEIFSHLLPKADPEFGKARAKFIASLDDNQKKFMRGDFERQAKDQTFDQWLNTVGGDAAFRGYVAKQYPKEFYRKDQVAMFEDLLGKLKEKQ